MGSSIYPPCMAKSGRWSQTGLSDWALHGNKAGWGGSASPFYPPYWLLMGNVEDLDFRFPLSLQSKKYLMISCEVERSQREGPDHGLSRWLQLSQCRRGFPSPLAKEGIEPKLPLSTALQPPPPCLLRKTYDKCLAAGRDPELIRNRCLPAD